MHSSMSAFVVVQEGEMVRQGSVSRLCGEDDDIAGL